MKAIRAVCFFFLLMGINYVGYSQNNARSAPYDGALRFRLSHGKLVRQDSTGRIYTQYDLGYKNQQVMLGTPYWGYPIWQAGTIKISTDLPVTACQLAYNVVANEILCRFNQDTTTYTFQPVAFTIGDANFVRRSVQGFPAYYQVLYKGDSELLEGYRRRMTLLKPQPYGDASMIGYFLGIERSYYLQLPDARVRSVELTRQSLSKAIGNDVYTRFLPKDKHLTVDEVISALAFHDAY